MTEVCTIFEGHYHYGAAALINSLAANQFQGNVWLGTRGSRPPWVNGLKQLADNSYSAGNIQIRFVDLDVRRTMSAEKPRLMQHILTELAPTATGVAYLDADIVIDTNWQFFEKWMSHGVALCEDNCLGPMSSSHYLRHEWRAFIANVLGTSETRQMNQYFNAGFVAATRRDMSFIDNWVRFTDLLPAPDNSQGSLKWGNRHQPFNSLEQDTLNVTAMSTDTPLATLGQEGMGFSPGLNVMWHAVDNPKPWLRHYISNLLRTGIRIAPSQRKYWEYANGLLHPWTNSQLAWKRLDLFAATALSRFYHSA